MRVQDKSIIVTGAGQGIGEGIARPLAQEGAPVIRFSTALDVANAALYLASDEAAFISGVCIEVDGARCV